MPREFHRTDRVGAQMQRELADLVRTGLNDPRFGMITIHEVAVARDFSHAKVYVTALGTELGHREIAKHLNEAAPMLRHELGQRIRIRSMPRLTFVYDESVERGIELHRLIDEVNSTEPGSKE